MYIFTLEVTARGDVYLLCQLDTNCGFRRRGLNRRNSVSKREQKHVFGTRQKWQSIIIVISSDPNDFHTILYIRILLSHSTEKKEARTTRAGTVFKFRLTTSNIDTVTVYIPLLQQKNQYLLALSKNV